MIGWQFPSNGGGQERGIADAGIQTFTGKEIFSLAREICQNSLDAVRNENFPVTVEFYSHEIFTHEMPACDDYRNILRKCRDYWLDTDKARDFFEAAIHQLDSPKIFVLQISDFNTTGLAEPFNARARTGWRTLTKIDGGATKTGDAAGSFGIGKNAPFTNSFCRLVFYRTLNTDKQNTRAAQGMARLVSFRLDSNNIAAGVGYFGDTNGNMPVRSIPELDKLYQRNEVGTDVFVYGFNGDKNWLDKIIKELLENFLVAIYRNKLCVKIQDKNINENNLGNFIARHEEKLPQVSNYHKILSGGDEVKIFELNFHDMGTFKLRVLCGENLSNKILVVRKSGMKLFDWTRSALGISAFIKFAAILEPEGVELNRFFRDMETPAHDKWEYKRHDDKKTAKEYLRELKTWLKNTINGLNVTNSADNIDVTGLSDMLNFDDGAIGFSDEESLDRKKDTSETQFDDVKKNQTRVTTTDFGTKRTAGDLTKNGTNPAIRKLGGDRTRTKRDTHTGEKNPDGANTIIEPAQRKSFDCEKVRVIKVDAKKYRLLFRIGQDIPNGQIEIFAVGENDTGENLSIASATAVKAIDSVQALGDKIVFKNLFANAEAQINFELATEKNYSLRVVVHEN